MSRTIIPVAFLNEVSHPSVSVSRSQIIPVKITKNPEPAQKTTAISPIASYSSPIHKRRSCLKILRNFLEMLITATAAIVAVLLVVVKIMGFSTFTIMSGSMEPNYPVGSMIYVRPIDYKSLKVGDVVSYVANNEKTIVR